MRLHQLGLLALLLFLLGCPTGRGGGGGGGGDDDSDADVEDDDDAVDACADYRDTYPEGPYGTSLGSVLAEFPGMVDGDGNTHTLFEIFQDRTVAALVIANAFDT